MLKLPYLLILLPTGAFAQPAQPSGSGGLLGSFVLVLLFFATLILVLRLVARRQTAAGTGPIPLQILGQMPLGTREKLVLIRVGPENLLIGVTANSITPLLKLDASHDDLLPADAASTAAPQSWQELLQRHLPGRKEAP